MMKHRAHPAGEGSPLLVFNARADGWKSAGAIPEAAFSVWSVLVNVQKTNLSEGKLSSNSGFLVLEQSC